MPIHVNRCPRSRIVGSYIGITISTLFFCLFPGFSGATSISAKGNARLLDVAIGTDSLYPTSICGVNTTSQMVLFNFEVVKNDEEFYEPIPDSRWLAPFPDTASAPVSGETRKIGLITRFPNDPSLINRRFAASVIVRQASKGMISLAIALKVKIETKSSIEIQQNTHRLAIAPIKAALGRNIDSLKIFNGANLADTVQVYWCRHLGKRDESDGVELRKRALLWEIPANRVVLKPGQMEWIYYEKKENYSGLHGYIVCIGKTISLYCRLE